MGIIRKTLLTATVGTGAFVGYLHSATTMVCPLPVNDSIWSSRAFRRYNVDRNVSTQDVVFRRIPLNKIRPELLKEEGDLVTKFCRGVWSGWAHEFLRRSLGRRHQGPKSVSQLWSRSQLARSTYEPGTRMTDHFEVVDKTPTEITVRCGSPLNLGPPGADGLFVISAAVDTVAHEVEVGLKRCFFTSSQKVEGIVGPMPPWIEWLHGYYSRIWVVNASRILLL